MTLDGKQLRDRAVERATAIAKNPVLAEVVQLALADWAYLGNCPLHGYDRTTGRRATHQSIQIDFTLPAGRFPLSSGPLAFYLLSPARFCFDWLHVGGILTDFGRLSKLGKHFHHAVLTPSDHQILVRVPKCRTHRRAIEPAI